VRLRAGRAIDGAVDLATSGGFLDDLRPELDGWRARLNAGEVTSPCFPERRADEARSRHLADDSCTT
jgi:hypothetical protein